MPSKSRLVPLQQHAWERKREIERERERDWERDRERETKNGYMKKTFDNHHICWRRGTCKSVECSCIWAQAPPVQASYDVGQKIHGWTCTRTEYIQDASPRLVIAFSCMELLSKRIDLGALSRSCVLISLGFAHYLTTFGKDPDIQTISRLEVTTGNTLKGVYVSGMP